MSSSSHEGGVENFPDYFDCVAVRNKTGGGWSTTNQNFEDSYIKENHSMCRVLSELYQECVKSKGSEHDSCNFFRDKASLCLLYMDESKKEFQRALAAKYPSKEESSTDCEYRYNSYKECVCRGSSCDYYPRNTPSCFQ